MADPVRGKLVWHISGGKRVRRVIYPTKKGMSIPTPFDAAELAASLRDRTDDAIEVELEVVSGKPVRIRPVGEPFVAAPGPQPAPPSQQQRASQQRGQQGGAPEGQRQPQQRPLAVRGAFHNPYNFVPALPRDGVTGELGDGEPAGHHVLYPDRYSGVIPVTMTAATPLLLPDAANAVDCPGDHKSLPVRVDAEGKPYIPPTSIKGMLRSAYEAVTNSRLTVFPGHDRKLAYRMATQEGLKLVPARVEHGRLILLPGTSTIGPKGPNGPLYAAWLPRYHRGQTSRDAVTYPDGQLPRHGDEVACWIELIQHWRWDRKNERHTQDFQYWRVRQIVPKGQPLGPQPSPTRDQGKQQRRSYHQPLGQIQPITGFVCITNPNIDRKHDERVFFASPQQPTTITLTKRERDDWETLIINYQQEHEEEIRQGRTGPPALSHSEWSRQIVGINGRKSVETELSEGTLLYAQVEKTPQGWQIRGLYPVNISRKLYEVSPVDLLPESLRPPTSLQQLSPADRVFGWVDQQGHGAYKGNVRIGPVTCLTRKDQAIEYFGSPGLPLAILGQPKPQQARFYVARNQHGEAQENGLSTEKAGYADGKGLRGRKVYPHHYRLPDRYWDNATEDRTQQASDLHLQEYRRPQLAGQEQRDNQNRSIQGWVKPGTAFTFDIHVTNLSKVEIGALLWLLSLPENHYHRFGGGKPLGFGSLRLEIDANAPGIYDGERWKQIYSDLGIGTVPPADHTSLITAFKEAVQAAYGSRNRPFDQVPFIAAFLRMATGHRDRLPTHYPRARQQGQTGLVPPHSEGKAYEWFVANDRTGRSAGPQVSLPDLAADQGLPMLDATS